ncbi:MAG: TlpA family protein disulfide reductase [Nitrospinae bacterium]|nr:TlpA family protein disulfide reductase [Nitrospinota bacterium]
MNKVLAAGFFSLAVLFSLSTSALALGKGDNYANFKLEDMKGNPVELSSFAGKVIFLDVWASWCPPCAKEMPFLMDAYAKYKDKGFVVVAVSVDDQKKNIEKFFKKKMDGKEPEFPVLFDPEKKVRDLYEMVGIPASVVIGKDGKIAYDPRTGFEESHIPEITKQIEEALAK